MGFTQEQITVLQSIVSNAVSPITKELADVKAHVNSITGPASLGGNNKPAVVTPAAITVANTTAFPQPPKPTFPGSVPAAPVDAETRKMQNWERACVDADYKYVMSLPTQALLSPQEMFDARKHQARQILQGDHAPVRHTLAMPAWDEVMHGTAKVLVVGVVLGGVGYGAYKLATTIG